MNIFCTRNEYNIYRNNHPHLGTINWLGFPIFFSESTLHNKYLLSNHKILLMSHVTCSNRIESFFHHPASVMAPFSLQKAHNTHTMDMLWEKFQWILPLYMNPINFQSKASVVCSVTAAVFIGFCLKKLNVFSQHISQKTNEYLNSTE